MISLKQEIESRHRKFSLSWEEFNQRKQRLQDYEFDKYRIVKKIGSGSFATVYLGVVRECLQQVAIKVIDLRQLNEIKNYRLRQIKQRLSHSQSRIMMRFSSAHIIKCYQTFQSQDFKFMIIEYCDGGDLGQRILQLGKLEQDEAISMLRQIANGLSECHSRGIIHRDLKPENVMLHNGVCKLADFGFSKMLAVGQESQNYMCVNTTLGTPTTMAPQVKNFQPYGLKADIWSLGVIFFNMLFGKCPFQSKQNFNKIMLRISAVLQRQQFYEGVRISDKVRKFLKQVLVVDPKQRLGWKGLSKHEIFEQESSQSQGQQSNNQQAVQQGSSSLGYSAITLRRSCFQRQVALQIDSQKMAKLQTEIVFNMTKNEIQPKQPQQSNNMTNKNNNNNSNNNNNIIMQQQLQRQIQNMLGSLKYCDQLINEAMQDVTAVGGNVQQQQQQQQHQAESWISQPKIKRCQSQMVQPPAHTTSHSQSLLYQWSRHAYFQCQKTQFIYNRIILPIQSLKLLQPSHRKCLQFMYLLCTRCYNNMAPIYYVFQNNKNSQVIKQLTNLIQRLYKSVEMKWRRYSYLLTKKENEKLEIAADWTKRAIFGRLFQQTSYQYEQRQKFMTGIQCVNNYHRLSLEVFEGVRDKVIQRQPENGLLVNKQQIQAQMKDYTRQEQIHYTLDYYNHIKDKFVRRQKAQTQYVMNCMDNFSQICNLTLEDLGNMTFKKYIQQLLSTGNKKLIIKIK